MGQKRNTTTQKIYRHLGRIGTDVMPGSSRERHRDKNDSAGLSPDCQFTQSVPIHFELLSLYSPGVSRGTKNIIPPATTIKYPITQTIFVRNYNSSS